VSHTPTRIGHKVTYKNARCSGSRSLKSTLRGAHLDLGLRIALSGQAGRAREVPHVSRNCHPRADVLAPYAHSQKKGASMTRLAEEHVRRIGYHSITGNVVGLVLPRVDAARFELATRRQL